VPLGHGEVGRPPVIVGVAGYSRWLVARMVPSRQAHDVLGGHLACLLALGGVPRKGVYDNEAALARRDGTGRARPTVVFDAFRGTLGMGVVFCRPGDPEAKGLVERANRYLETSFVPGRRFVSPADFNAQLTDWLTKANDRVHATLRCRPAERVVEDRNAMVGFPPVLPDPALRLSARLGRDHWVRVDTCDYSVHPRAVGRRVEVRASLDEVTITCGGELVGRHERCWARHRTITDPTHDSARREMHGFIVQAGRPGDDEVEVRDLSVYDRALGVA
jgi:hypothetical protein